MTRPRRTHLTARATLAVLGVAALTWGTVLFAQSWFDTRRAFGFLLGAPIVHDAIVAPVFALIGLGIARWVSAPWRTPIRVGAALSGVLALLAVPALWRTYAGPPNPGLADRDYGAGFGIALGMVWLIALTIRAIRFRRSRS